VVEEGQRVGSHLLESDHHSRCLAVAGVSMNVPPIHVISPVWGSAYIRCFLEVGLASLLSPGNLSGLAEPRNLLHVFTTEADRQTIESALIWRKAQEVLDCRIDIVGALNAQNPHATMSDCHRRAIALADGREAAMMFYNPDIVLADGGMSSLVRLLAQGK